MKRIFPLLAMVLATVLPSKTIAQTFTVVTDSAGKVIAHTNFHFGKTVWWDAPNSIGLQVNRLSNGQAGLISAVTNGQVYYNTTLEDFFFRKNGSWLALSSLGGGGGGSGTYVNAVLVDPANFTNSAQYGNWSVTGSNITLLTTNYPFLNGPNTFAGVNSLTNSGNIISGNGAGLTNLNASNLASGSVADARIPAAITRDSEWSTIAAIEAVVGNNILTTNEAPDLQLASPGVSKYYGTDGAGVKGYHPAASVTSVGLSVPAQFSVSGSPVTGSGILAVTLTNSTGSGAVVLSNAPSILNAALTTPTVTGRLAYGNLPTNTAAIGQVLKFDGTDFVAQNDSTGGAGSLYVNGGPISDANLTNSATAIIGVANSTNVTVNPTNLANAQISASAAISKSKISTSGAWTAAELGTGTADDNGFLRGDQTWVRSTVDGQLPRLLGGTLGFGALDLANGNAVTGTLADGNLSANIPLINGTNTWTGTNNFTLPTILTNSGNTISGNGAGLTNLNGSNIASGEVPNARLNAAVSLLGQTISESELAFTDITTANATSAQHGLLPKLSGATTNYLRGDGTFTRIALATDVTGNLPVTNLNAGTSASGSTFWRGDGTWATPAGAGTADPILFNNTAIADANGVSFTNTVGSSTVTPVTWTFDSATSPDNATAAIGNASGTVAGAVTAGTQTFGGDKTLLGSLAVTNLVSAQDMISSNSITSGAGSTPGLITATNGLTISNGGIDRTLTNNIPVLFKSNVVALVPITGDITGNAGTVTVIDTTDSTAFFAIFDNDTGTLAPKTDGGATYSAATGIATFTSLNTTGATITTLTNWGSLFLTAPNNTLPGMVFTSGVVETNQRNWGLGLNYDTTGDFVIRESSTNTTTPFVAGTTRFELLSGGGAAVSGYFQQDEQANPSTPASGKGRWFVSTTGKPSFIDDGGVVSDLSALGGGGEGSGTVHSGGALTRTDALVRAADATGTNVTTSSITINGGSNLYTASLIATNNVSLLQQAASSAIVLDANKVVTNLAINGTGPISASSGVNLTNVVVTGQTNTDLTASVPVFTDSTKKLTSTGTINAATAGITLTFVDYKDFVYPGKVDGTGCTILTNDYSSPLWGLATFNGTGETNANWSFYRPGVVPLDLDTSVELVVKNLAIRVSATDTDPATLDFGLFSPASSAGHAPTAWSSFGTFIRASVTPSTVAAEDIFYFSDITLTGWAAGVTAGRPLIVGIARLNTANDDSITIVSGTIQFTRTQ